MYIERTVIRRQIEHLLSSLCRSALKTNSPHYMLTIVLAAENVCYCWRRLTGSLGLMERCWNAVKHPMQSRVNLAHPERGSLTWGGQAAELCSWKTRRRRGNKEDKEQEENTFLGARRIVAWRGCTDVPASTHGPVCVKKAVGHLAENHPRAEELCVRKERKVGNWQQGHDTRKTQSCVPSSRRTSQGQRWN